MTRSTGAPERAFLGGGHRVDLDLRASSRTRAARSWRAPTSGRRAPPPTPPAAWWDELAAQLDRERYEVVAVGNHRLGAAARGRDARRPGGEERDHRARGGHDVSAPGRAHHPRDRRPGTPRSSAWRAAWRSTTLMNTLCAAGTGSFLSSQAHRLGVEVEEFGDIAATSEHPANIAARCTVFAESDLVHKLSGGLREARRHRGPVPRRRHQLPQQRRQGQARRGPGRLPGRRLQELRGGARLRGRARDGGPRRRRRAPHGPRSARRCSAADAPESQRRPSPGMSTTSSSARARSCAGRCANHCEVVCVYRDDELIDSWGNRCDRGAVRPRARA